MRRRGAARSRTSPGSTRPTRDPRLPTSTSTRRKRARSRPRIRSLTSSGGAKEFLERTDEFTVNVALVEDRAPVLGVVLAPARGLLFAAAPGVGASVEDGAGRRTILARTIPAEGATVVSSRSHGDLEALD